MCLRPPETCKQGCHLERRSSTCTWDRQSQPEISVSKSDRGRLETGGYQARKGRKLTFSTEPL